MLTVQLVLFGGLRRRRRRLADLPEPLEKVPVIPLDVSRYLGVAEQRPDIRGRQPETVDEDAGATTVTVTGALDGAVRISDTEVRVSVSAGTASADDFAAVADFTLTIPAGQSSGTVTFTLSPVDDSLDEDAETVSVGGAAQGSAMFRRRGEVEKFLAVAEAGRIVAAANRLAIGQPALTRAIAGLESRFGALLFERISTGARLTALGAVAAEQARRLLRAFEEAEDRIGGALAGRGGSHEGPERSAGAAQRLDAPTTVRHHPRPSNRPRPKPIKQREHTTIRYRKHTQREAH